MDSFMKRVQIVQAELKAPKNRVNKFGGYKYRNTEDILQGVKPLLKKNALVLTIRDEITSIGEGEKARFYVKATATLSDTQSGESLACSAYAREAEVKKGMDESQITGTASSYARKYALNGLFCIDDGIDADNPEITEALDELGAEIKCEGCGKTVRPFNDGKRGYTPVQIVRLSQMSFGKDFCWMCAKNARAEAEIAARANKKGE
jgi:hypothetical protein